METRSWNGALFFLAIYGCWFSAWRSLQFFFFAGGGASMTV